MSESANSGSNFLYAILDEDLKEGRVKPPITTRFPPEPNGYLHIGHAKSICLNFGLAEKYGGNCNLRFDDTNPEKENQEFIDAIQADIRWLGFQWHGGARYASDYFSTLCEYAVHLIRTGLAYVCELPPDQAREYRGTLTSPGRDSPYRDRSVAENLDIFESMRAGQRDEGSCALRAKIDMASPNMNLRDPILYRIRKASHHQTGDTWCIYPTYDFAHGQSDAIEGVTHSICSLEFEDHRPLYDWLIENLPVPSRPRQYEFARGNISYLVTSKRKIRRLIDEGHVAGWDDPRMPTLCGLRRRGYTPTAIRRFWGDLGVSRSDSLIDYSVLENAVRNDLNETAPRAMCVIDPLKLVITNYPEEQSEILDAPGHPELPHFPARQLPFSRELWIEREDFRVEANKKYKRLVIGKKVRLRNGYVITAEDFVTDEAGEITEVHCVYDRDSLGAEPSDGIKPRGVIHWVAAREAVAATVRLYDRLFTVPEPDRGAGDFIEHLNPASLEIRENCWAEPGLAQAEPEQRFQFERLGYFVADRDDYRAEHPVFNRVVALRDSWAKIEARQ